MTDMDDSAGSNTVDMNGPTRSSTVDMKEKMLVRSDTDIMNTSNHSNTVNTDGSMMSVTMDGPTRSDTIFMEEPAEVGTTITNVKVGIYHSIT